MNKFFDVREHVTLTGPMGEIQEMFDWLRENQFDIHRAGPKPVSIGRVDPEVFLIRASKVVSWRRWKS